MQEARPKAQEPSTDTEDDSDDSDVGDEQSCNMIRRTIIPADSTFQPAKKTCKPRPCNTVRSTSTHNMHSQLYIGGNDEFDAEVAEIKDAVKHFAHNVKSYKNKKNAANIKTMMLNNDSDIDKIANIIDSKGKRPKGPINLTTQADEVVSCVDSGSVETVANAKKVFPKHEVKPSRASNKNVA